MASSSSSSPELPLSRSTNNNDQYLSIGPKLHEVLEDLSSRFILNLPDGELDSLERVCFQVEQAHWYYEDFVREQDPSLPTMTLKRFSNSLFHVCPLLSHWGDTHEQTFQSFLAYKTRVPVCGAIMLNEKWDKCLLVKGWKATSAWSFPKGKINQTEERAACAIREVLEETGYDLAGQVDLSNVVEISIKDQSISLFIVPNVPEDFPFETRTRKEISKIAWFKLSELPTWKRNKPVPGKFYLITPFIGPLKTFLREHKPRGLRRPNGKSQHADAVSGDEDGPLDLEAHDPGAITHESSSQSSQENGDPHTPSPLYSEPVITQAATGISHDMQKTLSMDNVDPHFARLLSSLSLSASKPSIEDVVEGAVPALESVHGAIPHYPSEHSVSSSTNSSSQSGTARPSQSSRTPSTNPRTPPASTPHVSFTHNPQIARQSTPSLVQQQQQQRPLVIPKGSMAPVSPSTVRRISGSVDVSPYLARASTAAPPVPKQLKYISMLESVAKESERMTPKIERQLAARGDFLTMPGPHIGPPPVLPPGASYGPPGDSSVIYSSAQRPQRGFQPQPYPPYHHAQMPPDDAFIIRPRTSNNIHPAPYTSLSTRPSLSEDQLRAMMSAAGPRPPMPPVGPYHMPPPPHLAGPPRPGPPYLMAVPPVPAGRLPYPNLRLIPPQQLPPGQFAEQPLSAPAVSPAFNLIPRAKPAHNNAQLLSILNTPSLPRATPATSQPVLNPS